MRASSVFPILSVTLLFFGGLCVAASEFHHSRHSVILSAGVFFVSAGEYLARHKKCTDTKAQPGPRDKAMLFRSPAGKTQARVRWVTRVRPRGLSQT